MATKKDIRRLIKKGLTGREAARLILQDSWEVDHDKPGFLSRADIEAIKNSLKDPKEIQEYNKWIEAYRLVDYTLLDAQTASLRASRDIYKYIPLLREYDLDWRVRMARIWMPQIVTERQLQDIKASQRQQLLAETHTIDRTLDSRAYELASEEQREEADHDDTELCYQHPELYRQAAGQILELIQEGQLHPVQLHQEDIDRLEDLKEQLSVLRERRGRERDELLEQEDVSLDEVQAVANTPPADWTAQDQELYDNLWQEQRELESEAWERARATGRQTGDDLLKLLETISYSSLSIGEIWELEGARTHLVYTRFTGEDLYQTGLPEAVKWVDEYKLGFDLPDQGGYAIIQEPEERYLDEKGYYKGDCWKWVEGFSGLDELRKKREGDASLETLIQGLHIQIKVKVANFLAVQSIIEAVSGMIEVDFTESLAVWYEDIATAVDMWNFYRKRANEASRHEFYEGEALNITELVIDDLHPDPGEVAYLRERIALALGGEWLDEARKILARSAEKPLRELIDG